MGWFAIAPWSIVSAGLVFPLISLDARYAFGQNRSLALSLHGTAYMASDHMSTLNSDPE